MCTSPWVVTGRPAALQTVLQTHRGGHQLLPDAGERRTADEPEADEGADAEQHHERSHDRDDDRGHGGRGVHRKDGRGCREERDDRHGQLRAEDPGEGADGHAHEDDRPLFGETHSAQRPRPHARHPQGGVVARPGTPRRDGHEHEDQCGDREGQETHDEGEAQPPGRAVEQLLLLGPQRHRPHPDAGLGERRADLRNRARVGHPDLRLREQRKLRRPGGEDVEVDDRLVRRATGRVRDGRRPGEVEGDAVQARRLEAGTRRLVGQRAGDEGSLGSRPCCRGRSPAPGPAGSGRRGRCGWGRRRRRPWRMPAARSPALPGRRRAPTGRRPRPVRAATRPSSRHRG